MKIIKNKNIIIDNTQIASQLSLKDNTYILSENEVDVTTIQNIEILHTCGVLDYVKMRNCYKYLALDFNNQSLDTKNMIVKYCATDPMTIIMYLVEIGYTIQQAQYTYLVNRTVDIKEAAKCYESYLESPKLLQVIMTYLSIADGETFMNDLLVISEKYRRTGHYGIFFGDSTNGIFDYIHSYDAYSTTGLVKFGLPSETLNQFITDLENVLIYGNI